MQQLQHDLVTNHQHRGLGGDHHLVGDVGHLLTDVKEEFLTEEHL